MTESKSGGEALEMKFIHSSGPGGQNVNKVATAVQLRYDLARSGLTEAQVGRLRTLVPSLVTRDGFLVITARTHRSQGLNRAEALERLEALLARASSPPPKPRRETRPTRRAVERRLAEKKRRGQGKARRGRVDISRED